MQKRPGLAAMTALCVGALGCSYPSFQFGTGGMGGAGSASSSSASSQTSTSSQAASSSVGTGGMASGSGATASSSSDTASSSSASSSAGGPPPCGIGHLVISDIQSSGKAGAADEFVVLYNPTETPITIDASWALKTVPPGSTSSYNTRWTGGGGTASIPPHGHYLIAGSAYSGSAMPDDVLKSSIADEASLVLYAGGAPIDAVCYYNQSDPTGFMEPWITCSGMPIYNPQDGSSGAMIDRSIARKPGHAMGSCTDTEDNALDFIEENPSAPEDTESPPN